MKNIIKSQFIGVSIGESTNDDSGICVLNTNNELIKIDKAYSIDELTTCVMNISGKSSSIFCVDLPEYDEMLNNKWRIESKPYKLLKDYQYATPQNKWTNRFSERGSDFCKKLATQGYEIYRYDSTYIKTILNIHPYVKERTPAGCKFLQQTIKQKLEISDMPSNMIPISTLNAILGAYLAKTIATGEENVNYKKMGETKEISIMGLM